MWKCPVDTKRNRGFDLGKMEGLELQNIEKGMETVGIDGLSDGVT